MPTDDDAAAKEVEAYYASRSPEELLPLESAPDGDADWKDVRHEQLRFRAPADFEDRSLLTFIEPDRSPFRHSVVVGIEPTDQDLAPFAEYQLARLTDDLPDCTVSAPEPGLTALGLPFVEVRIDLRLGDGPRVRQVQAFFVVDGQGYTVTGSAGIDAFAAWHEQVFGPMLRSIRIVRER